MTIKKILFCFVCLISFFLFQNNVKALENTYYINKVLSENNTTIYDTDIPVSYEQLNNSFTFDINEYSNFYSQKSGNLKCGYDLYNKLLNGDFDGVKNNYDYWFITAVSYNNVSCRIYFYNKDNVILRYTNESQNSRWLTLYVKNGYYYQRSNSSYNNMINTNLSTGTRYLLYDVVNNRVTSNYTSWDSGNQAVVLFSSEDALKNVFGNSLSPTINITPSNNYNTDVFGNQFIESVSSSINFSVFDRNMYSYWYKFASDVWIELEENNHSIRLSKNGTLYVKVQDKNNNIVSSATHTVTGVQKMPVVEHNLNVESDTGMIYHNLIKVPISYLYDNSNNEYNFYRLVFMSKDSDDITSDFYITMDNLGNNDFPLSYYFQENIESLDNLSNSTPGSSGGGHHSSNGGRHEMNCNNTKVPYEYTIFNDNTLFYNYLYLLDCNATDIPSSYSNEYIYVYYNARLYNDLEELIEDYNNNTSNYTSENNNNVFKYLNNALNYFKNSISNIFKLISYFFNRMPVQLRYTLIASFMIMISLFAFKFML